MRVYCTGRLSEPHERVDVTPGEGLVYQCPQCRYDVSLKGVGAFGAALINRELELHHLAQLVTRARSR